MQLLSVNIGREQPIQYAKKSGKTGIFKQPVDQPVRVTSLGLVDDAVVDTENHGGVDQALYIYGMADYEWWSRELGRPLGAGTFGDNLTISELESASFSVGDILRVGDVMLQVTSPRIPCSTLSARMDDPQFVKRFRYAERPGLYVRVLKEGLVRAGDPVTCEAYTQPTVTILEMFRDFYEPKLSEAAIRRYLDAPIAIRSRKEKEEQLQKLVK